MPVLACSSCLWSEEASKPGSRLSWGSGRGRPVPWIQAASTVWDGGGETPFLAPSLEASKFGPRVEI